MLLDLLYLLALLLALPWIVFRLITTGRYREGNAARLWGCVPRLPEHDGPTVWFHAVSVGEVNLLPLLVSRLEALRPDVRCVISTTTKTGMEVAQKRFGQTHVVFYFPLDFSWAMNAALRRINPAAILLAELEVWPHLVQAAKRRDIPVIVFNGRISDASFGSYRKARPFLRSTFQKLDLVISQSEEYSERFEFLGVSPDRIETVGSIKFDGARTDRNCEPVQKVRQLTGSNEKGEVWLPLEDSARVFLAGSTQELEEEMALNSFLAMSDAYPELRLILVPRHPERFDAVAAMLSRRQVSFVRRTQLGGKTGLSDGAFASAQGEIAAERQFCVNASESPVRILLVDAMGELGAWWGTADLAFVGGSMGSRGGQNMLEPAAYGAAVSFGPNTRNFRDIVALLLHADAAVVVEDETALSAFVKRGLEDPDWRSGMGARARQLVLSQLGAADKTTQLISGRVAGPASNTPG